MFASLTSRIAALGTIVVLALVIFAWALLDASSETRNSFRRVTHSAEVIETMGDSLVQMREAESGQRGYLLTHSAAFAAAFAEQLAASRSAIDHVVTLTQDNPLQNSRARELRTLVDQRAAILLAPFQLAEKGDFKQADAIVSSGRGRDLMAAISMRADGFLSEERSLQAERTDAAELRLAHVRQLALVGMPILSMLVILVSLLVIRGIRRPINIILSAMAVLGHGDRSARIRATMGSREFAQLAKGHNAMAEQLEDAVAASRRSAQELQSANDELRQNGETLRNRGEVIELLGGMAHRMQAAGTDEELAQVIRVFVPRVLTGIPGALYAHNNSRNVLKPVACWGGFVAEPEGFAPDKCWALRRGQSHAVSAPGTDIVCAHVADEERVYHCEPLLAGGEVIGTLYLDGIPEEEHKFRLAVMAENIASALFNHRLQRGLREQSIRDPLTSLFNRRYMEEALALEIARAKRSSTPLSVVMCDVDHFKRFNDEFGHDAGDAVLQAVGTELRSRFRDGDIVCRYGGEEFAVIAPGTMPEQLVTRVEAVRRAITELNLRQAGRALGPISMSFGVSAWSSHADMAGTEALKLADAALYRAKREGRNRIILDNRDAA